MWSVCTYNSFLKLNICTLEVYLRYINSSLQVHRLNYAFTALNHSNNSYSPQSVALRISKPKLKQLFKVFTKVSLYSNRNKLKVHHSQSNYYSLHTKGGTSFSSLSLLNSIFNKFIALITNLFYFNIHILPFSSSAIKDDLISIYWLNSTRFKDILKYTSQSVFFSPNQMSDKYPFIFPFWKLNGYSVGLVYDVTYHLKTLYYLHRFNFYSVGILPSSMPKYKLSVAIPSLNDSWLSQLFMLRLTSFVRLQRSKSSYGSYKNLWYLV